jgi:hypothetical protein
VFWGMRGGRGVGHGPNISGKSIEASIESVTIQSLSHFLHIRYLHRRTGHFQ